jgi:hypothetical protein
MQMPSAVLPYLQLLPCHVSQLASLTCCHKTKVTPARHHAVDTLHLAGPGLGRVVALLGLQHHKGG